MTRIRQLTLALLLTLMPLASFAQSWQDWQGFQGHNSWIDAIRKLVPTQSLALFVSPGTQMIEKAKPNSKYPPLKLGDDLVTNGDFHDFTFDYSSVGDPSPFYESDFSVDEDGWKALRGTATGNVDGIDGEDDCLKYYANDVNSSHYIEKQLLGPNTQIYRISGKVYIPSTNTNVKRVEIHPVFTDLDVVYITDTDTWVYFSFDGSSKIDNERIRFTALTSSGSIVFIGANDPNDDIFYVKDIKVQRVGMVAHWIFDDYYHTQEGGGGYIGEDWAKGNNFNLTTDDFESETDGWNPSSRSTISVSDESVISGNKALKVECITDGYYHANKQWDVIAGDFVRFDFWTTFSNNTLYYYDGASYYSLNGNFRVVETDGSWRHFQGFVYVPSGAIKLRLEVGSLNGVVGDIGYIDSFNFYDYGKSYGLIPSSGFDYSNQLTGSDPAYRGGDALEFDGVDDYFSFTSFAASLGSNVSVNVWINFGNSVSSSLMELFTDAVYGIGGIGIGFNYGNQISVIVYNGDFIWFGCDYSFQPNTWYNIVATYDGVNKAIYINGVSQTINGNNFKNSGSGTIGMRPDKYSNYFQGYVAEIAAFNRTLSATEVKELYGKAKGWTWDGNGSIQNNDFKQVINGGQLTQEVSTIDTVAYKEHLVATDKDSVNYFGQVSSHTVTLGDGTWIYAAVQDLRNVDMTDTVAYDYSGNDYVGTMQGGLETGQPVNPYAWEFDGVDDYANFVGVDTIDWYNNDWIVCFWANPTQTQNETVIGRDAPDRFQVRFDDIPTAPRLIMSDGVTSVTNGYIADLSSQWHFYSIVFKSNTKVAEFYVDATLVITYDYSGLTECSTAGLYLGWGYGVAYMKGLISLLAWYYFDGKYGRLSKMPSNYKQVYIDKIWNNTRRFFGK